MPLQSRQKRRGAVPDGSRPHPAGKHATGYLMGRYVIDLILVKAAAASSLSCAVLDPNTAADHAGMAVVRLFGPYPCGGALSRLAEDLTGAFPDQFETHKHTVDILTILHITGLKRGRNLSGRDYPSLVDEEI